MGIDAEGLLLSRDGSAWRICSWAVDLPRSSLGLSKYSLLSHFLETEDVQLPLLRLIDDADANDLRQRCEAASPSYQMLKAIPGEWAELVDNGSGLAAAPMNYYFYAHGLTSFAQSLLQFLSTEFPNSEMEDSSFWEPGDYGGLLVQGLQLSIFGPSELDLDFTWSSRGELRSVADAPVGRVELEFEKRLQGQLVMECGNRSEAITFNGDKVSLNLGCKRLSCLSGRALEQLSGYRLFGPLQVAPDGRQYLAAWLDWFLALLMCLRRMGMPQIPSRKVLHFVRPAVLQVAIGISHDHICWQNMEWSYETPSLQMLESSEEELLDLVTKLQCHGCPFRLPFWFQF